MKNMIWNVFGTKDLRNGYMSTNTAEAGLCTFYAKEKCFNFMVVLGKEEREKFEADKEKYSETVQRIYDETKTYHDGKWLWFELTDTSLFSDMEKLLLLKRRPNKK
jgi:hypothetical protein